MEFFKKDKIESVKIRYVRNQEKLNLTGLDGGSRHSDSAESANLVTLDHHSLEMTTSKTKSVFDPKRQ